MIGARARSALSLLVYPVGLRERGGELGRERDRKEERPSVKMVSHFNVAIGKEQGLTDSMQAGPCFPHEDTMRYYNDPCRRIRGLGHPREPTPPEGA